MRTTVATPDPDPHRAGLRWFDLPVSHTTATGSVVYAATYTLSLPDAASTPRTITRKA